MTAADFETLGMAPPPAGSPETTAGTHWVVPRCEPVPAGEQPGGPSASSTTTASSPANAGTATLVGSPNWSGFQSANSADYTEAYTSWTVPSSFPTPPGDTYESSWSGLGTGDSNSASLLQAGTEVNVTTSDAVTSYTWFEFYPEEAQQVADLAIELGSTDNAVVAHTGYGTGIVDICTDPPGSTSGTCTGSIPVTWGTQYTLQHGPYECIAERTEESGIFPRLTDISGVQYYACEGYDSSTGSWLYIGNHDRYYYYMAKAQTAAECSTSPWAETTGSIYDSYNFPMNWLGYGYPIAASSC